MNEDQVLKEILLRHPHLRSTIEEISQSIVSQNLLTVTDIAHTYLCCKPHQQLTPEDSSSFCSWYDEKDLDIEERKHRSATKHWISITRKLAEDSGCNLEKDSEREVLLVKIRRISSTINALNSVSETELSLIKDACPTLFNR